MELIAPESEPAPDQALEELLDRLRPRRVLVATGAGISVASGLPTYRGADGYWTEGSANYEPEDSGYLANFRRRPRAIWRRHLYMRARCLAAEPNRAHRALAELEAALGDDFCLATQNVDGLHLRAGNSPARTIEAHGSVHFMRALDGEDRTLYAMDPELVLPRRDAELDDALWARLRTPAGELARPHAMFFDEAYDEALYRIAVATEAAEACDLLVVVGTSGATALPWALAVRALEADAGIVVVDPQDSPFASHARNRRRAGKGAWLPGSAERWVPALAAKLLALREGGEPKARPSLVAPRSSARPKPTPITLEPRRSEGDPGYAGSRALAELIGARPPRRVLVLSGAGLSAESGLPTYRGVNGLWTRGAGREPMSRDDFEADPRACWAFHLRQRAAFRAAEANAAHLALAELDRGFGDDLRVITQNIDGLHQRAGVNTDRVYELHGNCELMRAVEGDPHPIPIPESIPVPGPDEPLADEAWAALTMPGGGRARPHLLWWNEAYNEVQYRSESALAAAADCDLLVVIGTSGSAAMPYAIAAQAVLDADATLIDVNPEDNPYAEHARARAEEGKGLWLPGTAGEWIPELVELLLRTRDAEA